MAGNFGMFGSPIGEMAFTDMQGQQAQTQEALGRIAMQPGQMRKDEAQTELYVAQAQEARLKAMQEAKLAEIAQGLARNPKSKDPSDGPISMADQLDALAEHAASAGLITKAQELSKNAALIRSRDARALASDATAKKTGIDSVRLQSELIGRSFTGVEDQAAFDAANRFYAFNTGQPSPYEGMTYSPELVARIRDNALSVKDQADIAERARRNRDRSAYEGARLKQHNAALNLRDAQRAIAAARERRLAKAGGGKDISGPAANEIGQVKKFITKDFPGLEAADLNEAAYTIASDARVLRRQNRALSADEALRRAYIMAQQGGEFENVSKGIAGYGRKDVFKGGGRSSAAPAQLPPDPAKAVKGKFYINGTGVVAEYLGEGRFKVVDSGRPLSRDNGRLEPDPDDEEDDEEEDE